MVKRYTLVLNGGVGKHISATTMLRQIKQQEPDSQITVISAFPEVFLFNPNVHKNLHHMTSYVWDDYIKGSDLRQGDPYTFIEYYERKKHIAEIYPIAYRFPEMNKDILPEIYLSPQELKESGSFMQQSPKPIITIQITGGNQRMGQMKDPLEMTTRDLTIEQGQKIVDICIEMGFNVLQIALASELKMKNVLNFTDIPFRKYIATIPYIKGHIGIDSSMMHAVAAFKKPALIFWNNTHPNNLGYPYMTNAHKESCPTPLCGRPHVSIPDLVPEGSWVCPYGKICQQWANEELENETREFLSKLKEEVTKINLDKPSEAPSTKCEGCKS